MRVEPERAERGPDSGSSGADGRRWNCGLFAAWSQGSPVPDQADRRREGIADFAARRARVRQVPLFTAGPAAGDDQEAIWSTVELWDFGVPADIVPPGPVVSAGDAYRETPARPAP